MLTLITDDARNYRLVHEGTRMEASLVSKFDLPFSIQHNFTNEGVIIDVVSHETGEVLATSSEGWDEMLERMYPDFVHEVLENEDDDSLPYHHWERDSENE